MNDHLVELCVFYDYAEARRVANRLNDAGIPTSFSGEGSSIAASGFAPGVITIRLMVPERCIEQACVLLNSEGEPAEGTSEATEQPSDDEGSATETSEGSGQLASSEAIVLGWRHYICLAIILVAAALSVLRDLLEAVAMKL